MAERPSKFNKSIQNMNINFTSRIK